MGQCAPPTHWIDDDDYSIAIDPKNPEQWSYWASQEFSNKTTPIHQTKTATINNKNKNNNNQSSFLKLHIPDHSSKTILEQSQVYNALKQQSQELLLRENKNYIINGDRRQRRRRRGGDIVVEDIPRSSIALADEIQETNSRFGVTSAANTSFMSDIAPSELTTGTSATHQMSNLDRYAMKSKRKNNSRKMKNFSVIENISGMQQSYSNNGSIPFDQNDQQQHEEEDIEDELKIINSEYNNTPPIDFGGDIHESLAAARGKLDAIRLARNHGSNISSSNNDKETMKQHGNSKYDTTTKDAGGSGGDYNNNNNNRRLPQYTKLAMSSCFQPPEQTLEQRRMNKYMSVLHLKMRANLVHYYLEKYLPMFPNAAVHGISSIGTTKKGKILSLSSSSSSSSDDDDDDDDDIPKLTSDSCSDDSSSGEVILEFGNIPISSPIRFITNNEVFMDMAITGSLGLVPRNIVTRRTSTIRRRQQQQHYHNNNNTNNNNQKSPDQYIVLLHRRSGIPLAVCALKGGISLGPPTIRIYATKQRVFGQRQAIYTKQLGLDWSENFPLYSWAEIVADGEFPQPIQFSIFMSLGSDGRFSNVPSYKATYNTTATTTTTNDDGTSSSSSSSSTQIQVVGRTDKEHKYTGCALITIKGGGGGATKTKTTGGGAAAAAVDDDEPYFDLAIAQGIDPALMICFTAIVDEVLEGSMRSQCRSLGQRTKLRRVSKINKYHLNNNK